MALSDVFLTPLGLAALLAAVPIIVLYLIRPDPERLELPTFRFLASEQRQQATSPLLERLSRSVLLLVQLVVVLLLAVGLASPYVPVSERATVEETVLVVDTSASMTTADGSGTRFDRAISAAREEVTGTTSVVTTTGGGQVVLQRSPPSEVESTLDGLTATDSPGDLRSAVSQATALAGENARIVVLSDFAGDAWTDTVTTARGRGLSVDLRQFDGGGSANVGIVERRFSGSEVTVSVKNYGDEPVTRTVTLGEGSAQVDLGAGDVATVTLPVPAGRSRVRLSPGDDFPVDDSVAVAAPEDPTVDVLVLTNDRNRYLTTALSVVDQVDLTVDSPPTTVDDGYDVIIYSNVDPGSLLAGNVEAGRDVVADGGGVAIQAQPEMPQKYGDLLLLAPEGVRAGSTIGQTRQTTLTRGIDFQPPDEYVGGSLKDGQALVELADGTPLIATADRNGGRLMYYGYIEDRSSFKYNYQYPVFWKRTVFSLADRAPLSALNYGTGERAQFDADSVDGPDGTVAGPTVTLQRAGFYASGERTVSAALLDERESDVAVEALDTREGVAGNLTREERRTVPKPLTEYAAVGALAVALAEIGYLGRRGDL
ncbi:BatA and WFA domain-containing protein [Halomicroarcula limicola]|uniref:BatA and WFA domain-containing protein n=1 Tax=Haloarcula limicola TaxID=1429915 RepID=A0A8J7Y803_9EURY|nr:BatA and WFA domain-containing protein [Halomicroarcula limicola]